MARKVKIKKPSRADLKAMKVFLDGALESWAKPEEHQLTLDENHLDELTQTIAIGYSSDGFFEKIYLAVDKCLDPIDDSEKVHTDFAHREVALSTGKQVKLLYHRHAGTLRLCLPKGLFRERSIRELFLEHVHTLLGHFGPDKMLGFLSKNYWWPAMSKASCESCPFCQACKPSTARPMGLMHSPSLPPHPWHTVGIDFMGPLPPSESLGSTYEFLMVVIDHFSGEVRLIPTHTASSGEEVAKIWMPRIYAQHGLPKNIVSDRDERSTGAFWQSLHARFGTTLSMSSSFHPQSNGKTERANRTINSVMRQLVNEHQTNWAAGMRYAEFAINASRSESNGHAPFELTRGYIPATISSSLSSVEEVQHPDQLDDAARFVTHAHRAQMAALDHLIASRVLRNTAKNVNHRSSSGRLFGPEIFRKVCLSTKNLTILPQRARKFVPKFCGPFNVLRVFPQTDTYELDMPERYTHRGFHNKFYSSLRKPFVESDERLFPNRVVDSVPIFPLDEMDVDADTTTGMSAKVQRAFRSS